MSSRGDLGDLGGLGTRGLTASDALPVSRPSELEECLDRYIKIKDLPIVRVISKCEGADAARARCILESKAADLAMRERAGERIYEEELQRYQKEKDRACQRARERPVSWIVRNVEDSELYQLKVFSNSAYNQGRVMMYVLTQRQSSLANYLPHTFYPLAIPPRRSRSRDKEAHLFVMLSTFPGVSMDRSIINSQPQLQALLAGARREAEKERERERERLRKRETSGDVEMVKEEREREREGEGDSSEAEELQSDGGEAEAEGVKCVGVCAECPVPAPLQVEGASAPDTTTQGEGEGEREGETVSDDAALSNPPTSFFPAAVPVAVEPPGLGLVHAPSKGKREGEREREHRLGGKGGRERERAPKSTQRELLERDIAGREADALVICRILGITLMLLHYRR
ncbi:hypothetical protein KIPB_006623 [Kipferlia bialata]|uniref:Uncharacterized protein n=1 Tax=Kipferlia bialata TaxID=797122 RepID=A0A9K3GJD7_9EUKA|nr:hypothetical protein KIPB_006623 [Kipferlia bialata]|eukprot:g6623.t1